MKIKKMINKLIPKNRNFFYFEPLKNCEKDNCDIINFSSDSVLTFLNYFVNKIENKCRVYLVIFHIDRISLYNKYVSKYKNIDFVFLMGKSSSNRLSFNNKIKNFIAFCRSKYLFFDPILAGSGNIDKKQIAFSLGYFSTFKSDFYVAPFHREKTEWNLISATSKLDAVFKSSAYGVPFESFKFFGLPRNDNLLIKKTEKKRSIIKSWLNSKGANANTKIILYAPTYRDYENENECEKRSIWGFDVDDEMEMFLKKNNYLVIAKLHSWQNDSIVEFKKTNVINYKDNFDFSYYDLMEFSSVLITDYSSIALDFLLLNKPIVLNLYDFDLYNNIRGFAYEPYEDYCPGIIVKEKKDLLPAILDAINNDSYKDKREHVLKMAYKYTDCNSSKRIFDYLKDIING